MDCSRINLRDRKSSEYSNGVDNFIEVMKKEEKSSFKLFEYHLE